MGSVICSNEMKVLFERLVGKIKALDPAVVRASIIVPDTLIRSWLFHELAMQGISILDIEILLVEELFERWHDDLSPHSFFPLLVRFFENKAGDRTLVRQSLMPFMMRVFFGEKKWFLENDKEALWNAFIHWAGVHTCDLCLQFPTYLFGFSSLNNAFFKLVLDSPLFRELYLLSPCMLYWGDQCSDRQTRYMLDCADKKGVATPSQEQLEALLLDRHRFLANTGQVGRQFMLLIEDMDLPTQTAYLLPEKLFIEPYQGYISTDLIPNPCITPSLLDHLKADMLLLVGGCKEPKRIRKDSSIEIHAAYTPLREVEALFERIQKGCSLNPATILVFVTDISRYRAAFEHVFGSKCGYQIWGEQKRKGPLGLFQMVVALFSTKGRVQDWIQILRHEIFQKMLSIRTQEADSLISWLSERPTSWGMNSQYCRRYYTQRALPTESMADSSLSFLFDDYLDSFTSMTQEKRERIESSSLQGLGNFFAFLQDVERRFALPLEENALRTMSEWIDLFSYLIQKVVETGSVGYEEEALLFAQTEFEKIAVRSKGARLTFQESWRIFSGCIEVALSRRAVDFTSPVIVAEFGSVQPFPVELVALLGFQEDVFPKHDEDRLFSRLHRMVSAFPATNVGIDRYGVVEAILAAKNLFVGYQSYSLEKKISYSSVIDDLVSHLDEHYVIDGEMPSKQLTVQHPLYRQHRCKIGEQKEGERLFLPEKKTKEEIDVHALCGVAFSPLKSFFREQYSLYTRNEREDPLFVRSKDIRDSFLRGKMEKGTLRKRCISKELAKIDKEMTLYDLHLLPTVSGPQIEQKEILCPAFQTGADQTVVGSLSGLADVGILLFDEQWEKELFYRWPECVLRSFICQHHGVHIEEGAYITAKNQNLILQIPDSQMCLEQWVHFFSAVRQEPFPFSYEVVKLLIREKEGVYGAIVARAEREEKRGVWSLLSQEISQKICEDKQKKWIEWANALWGDFFVSVEER